MATVKVGSARSDEYGKAYGGKVGDQTGREVSTQNWYKHSKGWRVFRAKARAKALIIARQMQAACDNSKIGYDQWQRNTLYTQAKKVGFDIAKVTVACETDCSALVRVCCAAAGITDIPADFRTGNMPKYLLATGQFVELKGAKYTDQSVYLGKGDILVTKTSGHTVVALDDGVKYEKNITATEPKLGDRLLRVGSDGEDVKKMQQYLIQIGYDCGKWRDDGDFGSATKAALMRFQKAHALEADGVYGPKTHAVLMKKAGIRRSVKIVNGNCFVRTAPNATGTALGVVRNGTVLPYGGETSSNGWNLVEYKNRNGWVSGKYSKLE